MLIFGKTVARQDGNSQIGQDEPNLKTEPNVEAEG